MPHTVSLPDTPSPLFNVVVSEGGEPHSVDPFELLERCVAAQIVDDKGKWAAPTQGELVDKFKECIGLPSLTYTHTLVVIDGFMEYLTELEKTMPWLQTSNPSTDDSNQGDKTTEIGPALFPADTEEDPIPLEKGEIDAMRANIAAANAAAVAST